MSSPRFAASRGLQADLVRESLGAQFPSGLRVLLIESDAADAEEQLRSCSYAISTCSSVDEARLQLQSAGDAAFDVILMDAPAEALPAELLKSGVPLVLMGLKLDPGKLHSFIQQGAVDFLEKPLSRARLSTLWTHTVRRLMTSPAPQLQAQQQQHATSAGALPSSWQGAQAHRPQQRADSGASASMSAHAESGSNGSNASTSEAVTHKPSDPEPDNTSSLVGDELMTDVLVGAMLRGGPHATSHAHMARIDSQQLGALASGMSHLLMNESGSNISNPATTSGPCGASLVAASSTGTAAAAATATYTNSSLPAAAAAAAGGTQPDTAQLGRRRSRELAGLTCGGALERSRSSPLFAAGAAGGRTSQESAVVGARPVVGHPAGRLPPLVEADGAGVVWGLPTTPLNIVPKAQPGCAPMPGAMPGAMQAGMQGVMQAGMQGAMPGGMQACMPAGMPCPSPFGMLPPMPPAMPGFMHGVGLLPGFMPHFPGMLPMHGMSGMPPMGMGMGPGLPQPGVLPPLAVAAAAPDLPLPPPPPPGMVPTCASGGVMMPPGLIPSPHLLHPTAADHTAIGGSAAGGCAAPAATQAALKQVQSTPMPCVSPPLPIVPGSFGDFGDVSVIDEGDPLAALDPQQLLVSCGFPQADQEPADLMSMLTATGPHHGTSMELGMHKTPSFVDMVDRSLHGLE